jgi:RNA recognition motif-containing protein
VLFDPKKTSVLVKNVPPGINQDAMRHVFGTYGLVHHVEMPAVYADGTWATETCVVTMSNREGAETASAALSGVYRFEETQLLPVALAWCGQDPDVDAEHQSGIGEKRKRVDEDVIEAVTRHKGVVSGHQLAVVGVPMGATETDIAAYFGHECQLDKDLFVLMFHDTRTAFVSFADANKAQHAMETFGKHGTLRPNGSAIPVTLRWLVVSLQERKAPAKRAAPPPAGVWPPVPRPGPQYGKGLSHPTQNEVLIAHTRR